MENINNSVLFANRLLAIFDYCKNKGICRNQNEFAGVLNCNISTLSKALNGNPQYSTLHFLQSVNDRLGGVFDKRWILTGEGDMLASGNSSVQEVSDNSGPVFVNSGNGVRNNQAGINARLVDALIAQQGHLTKSQEQIDRLLTLLEQRDKK